MSFVLKGVQYANKTTIILSTMKTQKTTVIIALAIK